METFWTVFLIISLIFFLWVLPIKLGIDIAKKKNISPLWMWFGIHPFFGWIAVLVLNSVKPRKICPNCEERIKKHAKICPYCLTEQEMDIDGGVGTEDNKISNKLIIGALVLILLTPYFYFYFKATPPSKSWVYQNAIENARRNPDLIKLIGEPVEVGEIISHSSSWVDGKKYKKLQIDIQGNKSKGVLIIKARKNGETWEFETLRFEEENKNESINLIQ